MLRNKKNIFHNQQSLTFLAKTKLSQSGNAWTDQQRGVARIGLFYEFRQVYLPESRKTVA